MPSCVMNNYNVDSILVTRPANVTLTGCHVTSNFYANFLVEQLKQMVLCFLVLIVAQLKHLIL